MTISITFEGLTQGAASAVIGALSAYEAAQPTARQTQAPVAPTVTAPQAMPAAVPVQPPAQPVPPVTVPTQAPTYTLEQISRAGAELAGAGRIQELLDLLRQFGIEDITLLPPEQYGAMATALRSMGARI